MVWIHPSATCLLSKLVTLTDKYLPDQAPSEHSSLIIYSDAAVACELSIYFICVSCKNNITGDEWRKWTANNRFMNTCNVALFNYENDVVYKCQKLAEGCTFDMC